MKKAPSWKITLISILVSPIALGIDIWINVHGGIGLTLVLMAFLFIRLLMHAFYYFQRTLVMVRQKKETR